MYLNVILTIFVILQIVTIVLIYKWWNKYGRNLFKSVIDMKKGFLPKIPDSVGMGNINEPNLLGQMPDIGKMMKQFENFYGKK